MISVTTTRIRAGVALTGSIPDGEAPISALQQQRDANLPLPPHLVMDQIGGWGKCRARTYAVSDGQTQMVARIPLSGGSDPSRFSVADFQIDAERTTCTCPAGVVSTKAYASGDGDGVHFRFTAPMCRGCTSWGSCRDPEANPTGHRSVFISDYHLFQRAAARFNASPLGRTLLGGRWRVEPVVAWLVRYQGCRRARRVGTAAAQAQLYEACAMAQPADVAQPDLTRVGRATRPMIPRLKPDSRQAPAGGPVAAWAKPARSARSHAPCDRLPHAATNAVPIRPHDAPPHAVAPFFATLAPPRQGRSSPN